jgi:hypothetical protein
MRFRARPRLFCRLLVALDLNSLKLMYPMILILAFKMVSKLLICILVQLQNRSTFNFLIPQTHSA